MKRWIGKIAVVTGASSGIGAAIATQLVNDGVKVIGLARRTELIEKLGKNLNGNLIAYKTDITNEIQVIDAFNWIEQKFGTVHILVNNSGVSMENTLIDGDSKKWKNTFDVNVMGLLYATREAVRQMREKNVNGHIVHINSISGHSVPHFPNVNVYPATKFAVTALTETLRQEFNLNQLKIKVSSISPGLVDTDMITTNEEWSQEQKDLVKQLPMLNAKDIANGVKYVLSTPEHVQVHELTIKPIGEIF